MSEIYEIHIDSRLGDRMAHYFDEVTIRRQKDDTTVLVGEMVDQAALHGLLAKVRDLGLPLLNVTLRENRDQETG